MGELIVLTETEEVITLREVGRAFAAFVRTVARWTHHHWNVIAWPVDALLGVVVAIATFQITWRFIWSMVLDEGWWPPEIALLMVKPLVGIILIAAWLQLVLARKLPIARRGVFGFAGMLAYDWRHRHQSGTLIGYAKTLLLAIAVGALAGMPKMLHRLPDAVAERLCTPNESVQAVYAPASTPRDRSAVRTSHR